MLAFGLERVVAAHACVAGNIRNGQNPTRWGWVFGGLAWTAALPLSGHDSLVRSIVRDPPSIIRDLYENGGILACPAVRGVNLGRECMHPTCDECARPDW